MLNPQPLTTTFSVLLPFFHKPSFQLTPIIGQFGPEDALFHCKTQTLMYEQYRSIFSTSTSVRLGSSIID